MSAIGVGGVAVGLRPTAALPTPQICLPKHNKVIKIHTKVYNLTTPGSEERERLTPLLIGRLQRPEPTRDDNIEQFINFYKKIINSLLPFGHVNIYLIYYDQ